MFEKTDKPASALEVGELFRLHEVLYIIHRAECVNDDVRLHVEVQDDTLKRRLLCCLILNKDMIVTAW